MIASPYHRSSWFLSPWFQWSASTTEFDWWVGPLKSVVWSNLTHRLALYSEVVGKVPISSGAFRLGYSKFPSQHISCLSLLLPTTNSTIISYWKRTQRYPAHLLVLHEDILTRVNYLQTSHYRGLPQLRCVMSKVTGPWLSQAPRDLAVNEWLLYGKFEH